MKQALILWLGAFVLTFLTGYFHSLISVDYPVSGSFGVGLKKVSYFFDRTHYGKNNYEVIIRTEVENLNGKVLWRKMSAHGNDSNEIIQNDDWHTVYFTSENEALTAEIPYNNPRTTVEYKVILNHGNSTYRLPASGDINLKFLGGVPKSISIFAFLSLFGALLLSVRTGLDYFNGNEKIKKLSLFTLAVWFTNVMIFSPITKSYQLSGNIGMEALPISDIFELSSVIMLVFWILSVIIIFNIKNYKLFALFTGIVTIVLFQFIN